MYVPVVPIVGDLLYKVLANEYLAKPKYATPARIGPRNWVYICFRDSSKYGLTYFEDK